MGPHLRTEKQDWGSARYRKDTLAQSRPGLTQGPCAASLIQGKIIPSREKPKVPQGAGVGQEPRGHQRASQLPLRPGPATQTVTFTSLNNAFTSQRARGELYFHFLGWFCANLSFVFKSSVR